MIFTTVSGSLYEISVEEKKIRRLHNEHKKAATLRQGDNEWKSYASIYPDPPEVGKQLMIVWDVKTTPLLEGSPEGSVPTTVTSQIVVIDPVLS